jgi:hypothetical protein
MFLLVPRSPLNSIQAVTPGTDGAIGKAAATARTAKPAEFCLATAGDLFNVIDHFAHYHRGHSLQRRLDQETAQAALSNLLLNIVTLEEEVRPQPAMRPVAIRAPSGQPVLPAKPAKSPGRHVREAGKGARGREYCKCGHCKACLDNARWEQIFNERFAVPGYYGAPTVSHSSTLAGLR